MTALTVLFLCQHNAGRSQLAAALLDVLAGGRYTATSAGMSPADTINPAVVSSIAELGVDIGDRTPGRSPSKTPRMQTSSSR